MLEHAEAHVLRILDDLCGDVEAYLTAFGDDAGLAGLILVGAQEHERGVLDVSISGDRDELVILMEMLPLRAGPISVRLIEAWRPGGPRREVSRAALDLRLGGRASEIARDQLPPRYPRHRAPRSSSARARRSSWLAAPGGRSASQLVGPAQKTSPPL